MSRQTVSKAQQQKNSTLPLATDILQRKGMNRTNYGASIVDARNPSGKQADKSSLSGSESNFNHDFSKIPVRLNSRNRIQAKLKIGQPDDKYEQEADEVAEQVMRMPEPQVQRQSLEEEDEQIQAKSFGTPVTSIIQRQSGEEEEQDLQTKPLIQRQELENEEEEPEEELIQTKTAHGQAPDPSTDIVSQIQDIKSNGQQPLDPSTRAFMEPRLGKDFSQVRIHTGNRAAEAAKAINAKAFTLGHDIVFGSGQYQPNNVEGKRLLAHELTHVVQQNSLIIHRQAKQKATKKAPISKKKTLKGQGIDVVDPVFSKTSQIIDAVLQRNQILAPYIGKKIKSGFKIAEKGKFILELSDGNFDNAYRKAYGLSASSTVRSNVEGFYDSQKSKIHLRPSANFGTALHETVHKLATPHLYSTYLQSAKKVSNNLADVLNEGLTAYFTDTILDEEGLSKHIDAYSRQKKKANKLVKALGVDGFDLIARFYFKGDAIVEIGNKLGLSKKQFINLKGKAFSEVFKLMNKQL